MRSLKLRVRLRTFPDDSFAPLEEECKERLIAKSVLPVKRCLEQSTLAMRGTAFQETASVAEVPSGYAAAAEQEGEMLTGSHDGLALPAPPPLAPRVLVKLEQRNTDTELRLQRVRRECIAEVEHDYLSSMKKSHLFYRTNMLEKEADFAVIEEQLREKEKKSGALFARMALAKSGAGVMDHEGLLFVRVSQAAQEMSSYMFVANANVQRALIEVLACLEEVHSSDNRVYAHYSTGFFDIPSTMHFPMNVNTFKKRMEVNTVHVISLLAVEWPALVSKVIKERLGDFFDFKTTSLRAYEHSRLRQFLHLINMIMETQLRSFILKAQKEFLHLLGYSIVQQTSSIFGEGKVDSSAEVKHILESPVGKGRPVPLLFLANIGINPGFLEREANASAFMLKPTMERVQEVLVQCFLQPVAGTNRSIPHIERILLESLFLTEDDSPSYRKNMRGIEPELDDVCAIGIKAIYDTVWDSLTMVNDRIALYKDFEFLLKEDPSRLRALTVEGDSLAATKSLIESHNKAHMRLVESTTEQTAIAPFLIDCDILRNQLLQHCDEVLSIFRSAMEVRLALVCDRLASGYDTVHASLRRDVHDVIEWGELRQALVTCTHNIDAFNKDVLEMRNIVDLFFFAAFSLSDDLSRRYWAMAARPNLLLEEAARAKERLRESYQNLTDLMSVDRSFVQQSSSAYTKEVDMLVPISDLQALPDMLTKTRAMRAKLNKLIDMAKSVTFREQKLEMEPITRFSGLESVVKAFEPFEDLWNLAFELSENIALWHRTPFMDITASRIVDSMEKWRVMLRKLFLTFRGSPEPFTVASKLKAELDTFGRHLKIVTALRNPALRDRHWEQFSKRLGLSMDAIRGLTLNDIIEMDLELIQDTIVDMSDSASSEYAIEQGLVKIDEKVRTTDVITEPWHIDKDVILLKDAHNVVASLRALQHELQTLEGKRGAGRFRKGLLEWEERLTHAQEFVEKWDKMQRLSLNVYAVARTMTLPAGEIEHLHSVDACLRLLSNCLRSFRTWNVFVYRRDVLSLIDQALPHIDRLSKAMSPQIDDARKQYPKAHLLMDFELFDLLANGKHVDRIAPLLCRLFPYVRNLSTRNHYELLSEEDPDAIEKAETDGNVGVKIEEDVTEEDVEAIRQGKVKLPPRPKQSFRQRFPVTEISQIDNNTEKVKPASLVRQSELRYQYIVGFESLSSEKLELRIPVRVTSNIFTTLSKLEFSMEKTLRHLSQEMILLHENATAEVPSLAGVHLSDYMRKYPHQLRLMFCYLNWTRSVEAILAIKAEESRFKSFRRSLQRDLELLFSEIKVLGTSAMREHYEGMASQLWYLMGTFDELVCNDIHDVKDLIWQRCFRVYANETGLLMSLFRNSYSYGYQYQCKTGPLLLHEGSERSLRDILTGFSHKYWIALSDYVYSDQTVDMLAVLTGRNYHTIFCNDETQLVTIQAILSACGHSGTYVHLKNFDRCPPEVKVSAGGMFRKMWDGMKMPLKEPRMLNILGNDIYLHEGCKLIFSIASQESFTSLPLSLQESLRIVTLSNLYLQSFLKFHLWLKGIKGYNHLGKQLAIAVGAIIQMAVNRDEVLKAHALAHSILRSMNAQSMQTGDDASRVIRGILDVCRFFYSDNHIPRVLAIIKRTFGIDELALGAAITSGIEKFVEFVDRACYEGKQACKLRYHTSQGHPASGINIKLSNHLHHRRSWLWKDLFVRHMQRGL